MSKNLTQADKEHYIQVIHRLWPQQTQYYTADDVTESVAEIVDTVLDETVDATRAIAGTLQIPFELLALVKEKEPQSFAKAAWDATNRIIDVLSGNRRYKFVIDTAALKYKHLIELAFMGL